MTLGSHEIGDCRGTAGEGAVTRPVSGGMTPSETAGNAVHRSNTLWPEPRS